MPSQVRLNAPEYKRGTLLKKNTYEQIKFMVYGQYALPSKVRLS